MGWYNVFSSFYDGSLERLYRPFREAAAARLGLAAGMRVLDAGCGTGQSLEVLAPAVGDSGLVIGVDLSPGMLEAAGRRVAQRGFTNVRLVQGSLLELERASFAAHLPEGRGFDRAIVFLALTTLPAWEEATARIWDLVEPGGALMIVDTHADSLGLQGRLVNLMARADIRRRVWSRLEQLADDFTLERLKAPYSVGGDIVIARGSKPAR